MVTPSSRTTSTGPTSAGSEVPIRSAAHATMRVDRKIRGARTGQGDQRCAHGPEPDADDQGDGEHGEELHPGEVVLDDVVLRDFRGDGPGHPDDVAGRVAEVPVHVSVRSRGLRGERGARREVEERDYCCVMLPGAADQARDIGDRDRARQAGDAARRPGADWSGGDLRGIRVAGLGQGRRRLCVLGLIAWQARQRLVDHDGLPDGTVKRRLRHAASVALHDSYRGVDWRAEQPGRVRFRAGRRGVLGNERVQSARGGGGQRWEEDDGERDGRDPAADDEVAQGHDGEGVSPWHNAHDRLRGGRRPRGDLGQGTRAAPRVCITQLRRVMPDLARTT